MELAFKVAILHAKWYEVKCGNGPPSHRVDLRELLAEALEIDDEFQIYTAIIPQGWRHHVQANTPAAQAVYTKLLQKLILQGSGAPRVIHSYANVKRCWMSNFHQTSRMFLLRDVLEILNWMLRMPESGPSPMANGSEQIEMTGGLDAGHINDLQPQLDDKTLCMRHASVTNDLANLIEDGCAAIISGFAVNIPGRSVEDISTVRGYIAMWKMGTMDAILKAGLIPDANLPISPPPDSISLGRPEHKQTPVFDPSLPVHHIFDYRPKHPYDFPVDLPYVDNDCTDTIKIDLVARRLWINRILYYIGKELGVSKALAVWYIEGLTNVKMEVDAILGKA